MPELALSAIVSQVLESPWWRRARCRGRRDLNFYSNWQRQIQACRKVCRACPVRAHCAVEALLRHDPWGIWGGLTPEERIAIIAGQQETNSPEEPMPHGTNARYVHLGCRCVRCEGAHQFYQLIRAVARSLGITYRRPPHQLDN